MGLMTHTPFVVINSDILLARLNGPLLKFFDNNRLIEITNLFSLLEEMWVYSTVDIHFNKIEVFINESRNSLKSYSKNIDESLKL